MSGCKKCCGNCGGCGELVLSPGEVKMLQTLSQIPFLPVARQADNMDPVYLEEDGYDKETCSLILQCLEKRGLISIDYDMPLKGTSYGSRYEAYPVRGSFALTAKGQDVLQVLELQGITEA